MTYVLAALLGALATGVPYLLYAVHNERSAKRSEKALAVEQSRVNDLLVLIQAKAAPAEFAAYVTPQAAEAEPGFMWDSSGLIAVPLDDDD